MKNWLIILTVVLFAALFIPLPSYVTSECGPYEDCPVTSKWVLGKSIFNILTSSNADDINPIPQEPNPPDLKPTCGIQECHGPSYTCGEKTIDACDEMFTLGDYCREFVSCEVIDGKCQTIAPKLTACASCVKKCQLDTSTVEDGICVQSCIDKI